MLDRDYILEKHTILNDFTLNKDKQEYILNSFAKQREDRIKKRELKSDKAAYQKAIDKTYEEIIELYKQHDIELAENPMLESFLKRSYGSKAGGIVNRRNKLKKQLSLLDE